MGRLTKQQDDALTEALLAIHQGKQANLAMGRLLKSLQRRNLLDQSEVFEVQTEMMQGRRSWIERRGY